MLINQYRTYPIRRDSRRIDRLGTCTPVPQESIVDMSRDSDVQWCLLQEEGSPGFLLR